MWRIVTRAFVCAAGVMKKRKELPDDDAGFETESEGAGSARQRPQRVRKQSRVQREADESAEEEEEEEERTRRNGQSGAHRHIVTKFPLASEESSGPVFSS